MADEEVAAVTTHATLTEAMIAAQMAFDVVRKQSENPHFKAKYADLATVIEAVLPALNANGILLTQPVVRVDDGLVLRTKLTHTSGDELVSEVPLPPPTQWQQWGSALTYCRRYAIMSLVGVAPEEDDGNDAAGVPPRQQVYKPRGEVTDPARKAQLAQQARAQQNAAPPAERPHEPADSRADPGATRAAGDDFSAPNFFDDVKAAAAREWTQASLDKRLTEINAAFANHDGDLSNLKASARITKDEVSTMPQWAQDKVRDFFDDQREAIEAAQ